MKTLTKSILSIIFICLLLETTHAQLSQGGTPIGLQTTNASFPEINSALSNAIALQEPNIDSLKTLAEANDGKNNPYMFANSININLNIKSKDPIILADQGKLWVWKFSTKKALSLNAYFTKFKLAEGAKLFVYRPDGKRIAGAFTAANNQEHNTLSVELIEGNEAIIEYYEPANLAPDASEIFLGVIGYGFRGVSSALNMSNVNESDDCNINVNCPQGADYQVIKKSVAKIIFQATNNGWYLCSGSVVNNTAQNKIPYFLTAFHCYDQTLLNTYIFYFNYESPNCSNPTTAPPSNTLTGATFKAAYSASDFALIQINNTIPDSYNVYYAGWDKSDTAPSSAVSIHHPSGDIKKIAIDNHAPTKVNITFSGQTVSSWRVYWDAGITEGGSSGSFLINSSTKRIIGQLFGGGSYCWAPNSPDYYGRLAISWNGNGTSSTRLKDWLDPLNTNVNTLDGMFNNSIATTVSGSSFCQGASISVNFTTSGTINVGNVFTAQLSNSLGSFSSPTNIGTLSATTSGTINATIPGGTPAGSGYRIRVISSSPAITGTDNGANITINAIPAAPSASPVSRCGPGTVTLSATGCAGGTIKWFANATATTTLATGGSFTTPSISANTTYYVGCTVGVCNSTRTSVLATVTALPAAPSSASVSRCGPGTVTLSATGCAGGTIKWFANATATTTLATGGSFTTPSISANTTYYVGCTIGVCNSTRTSILATVTALPAAPSSASVSRCGTGTVTLSATGCAGGTIKWFANATATTTLATGGTFTTPSISANTTYYVGCTIGVCNSTRTSVLATVNITLSFTSPTQASGVYSASQTITSASNVASPTTYGAGKSITLVPGFQAGKDEIFLASIQNCP